MNREAPLVLLPHNSKTPILLSTRCSLIRRVCRVPRAPGPAAVASWEAALLTARPEPVARRRALAADARPPGRTGPRAPERLEAEPGGRAGDAGWLTSGAPAPGLRPASPQVRLLLAGLIAVQFICLSLPPLDDCNLRTLRNCFLKNCVCFIYFLQCL